MEFCMFEELFSDLYRLEIPLPKSPLKALNAYLIKGDDRWLLIDTGMNRKACLDPMLACLKTLGVDLNRTDFFITHLHADHLGLLEKLAGDNSTVYFSHTEASLFNSIARDVEKRQREFSALLHSHGFPEDELKKALKNHPGYRYSPGEVIDFTELKEGDIIRAGDYTLTCIDTPGHSPGHMCLYEKNKKILFSGDHILADITPNITCWPDVANTLKAFLESLDKVYTLDVDHVLTGHRSLIDDHKKRIRELKAHHGERLAEALSAVKEVDRSAWDVAPLIAWDIRADSWEQFPPVQKWFAMGETIAHLIYLESEGKIRRIEENGTIKFTCSSSD
jgi:glyoxylase-like metal-dependent hydrolase (beta-lactamase superfamily II)